LGKSSANAGIYLLFFFIGFAVAAQVGGRMLDRIGAKRPVMLGCAIAAVGFYLWAGKATDLSLSAQEWYVVVAGAGMGMMLGPASTDAVNRASRLSYGEATGITQTVRNYAASLGLAVLGTILLDRFRSELTASFISQGVPATRASQAASTSAQGGQGGGVGAIPHFARVDFAHATQAVLYVMAGIMATAALVALLGLRAGAQEEVVEPPDEAAAGPAQASPASPASPAAPTP
jgi:MFS family permease